MPIAGATVTVTAAGAQRQATTGANGAAEFLDLQTRNVTLTVSAAGFESLTGATSTLQGGSQPEYWEVRLDAIGAWATGRAIVLGTRVVDLASDGSAMTFSIDTAVIGENAEALETLTSANFSIVTYDCGWGGPRDCASDADGNATGNFLPDGEAQVFELRPASARHPYIVSVLVERSDAITDWDWRGTALKSFFTALGGNDMANLASVQTENGSATLTVLGPFTNDGSTYLGAIDLLARPAAGPPAMLDSLAESIRLVAAVDDGGISGAERTVLVLARQGLTVAEINAVTELARQMGVHVSIVYSSSSSWYGFSEASVRTGGLAADFADPRQLAMIFEAMDPLLAGTVTHYRMQFRITGSGGTFVSGGNVKSLLLIDVPSTIPNRGVYTNFDVAIP
jgi:hypothetical protein